MESFQWEIKVPIFRNKFILRDIGLAIGIPFGILIGFFFFISKGRIFGDDTKYAVWILIILFTLTVLLILAINGGKYAPGFIVDKEGIINYTQSKQAKKNFIINTLTFVFGLLSRALSLLKVDLQKKLLFFALKKTIWMYLNLFIKNM